jgi:hypothetical protein
LAIVGCEFRKIQTGDDEHRTSLGLADWDHKSRSFSDNEILTLNLAGPRESKEPGVAEFVREILEKAFSQ